MFCAVSLSGRCEATAIFSMAKSSCADKTILAAIILTNSRFVTYFTARGSVHLNGPNKEKFKVCFGLPFSILRFLRKEHFYTFIVPKTQGKHEAEPQKSQSKPPPVCRLSSSPPKRLPTPHVSSLRWKDCSVQLTSTKISVSSGSMGSSTENCLPHWMR